MVCDARERDEVDCVLCYLRNLTATLFCRHVAVQTSCLEKDLTMSEW